MKRPAIVYLCLMILGLGVELAKHGEEKTGLSAKHNFFLSLLSNAFLLFLLYKGGLFDSLM